MGKRFNYEYVVIGGGLAGITAAIQLAEAGRKVAIIEKDHLGGISLYYRDVPSSTLFFLSHFYSRTINASKLGFSSANLKYDYATFLNRREKVISQINATKKELEDRKIAVIKGRAHFVGTNDIVVDSYKGNLEISASKFIIATGTELDTGTIGGLDEVPYLTPASALTISHPPKAVLIVGGGATGCEIAQYYAELGAKVVIVELSDRILPHEDEDISKVISQYLEKRCGVKIFTNTKVVALEKDKIATRAVFLKNGEEKTVRVGSVVLATGQKPFVDIGLKNAGVSYDKKGIIVDRTLQTSARHIFAIGGAIDSKRSSEKSAYTGEVAVMNMLDRNKTFVNYDGFMRCIDTDPSIAVVGLTEDDLMKRNRKYRKALVPLSATTAAIIRNYKFGFLKLLADSQGKILGAAMVGPNASEVLQEVALAMRHGLPLIQVASTPHRTNDWNNIVKIAARKLLTKR